MKKITLFLSGTLLFTALNLKADEGMWLPILINQNMATMTLMGLQLTADDIYNINQSSLKDAVIALDHGSCTGELVSAEGLVLTNHHCGYEEIQEHSTVDHDYLTNGFWAMSKKEELANPGKTASFLIMVEDVTQRILSAIPADATEIDRKAIVDSISSKISEEATMGTVYEANVESMFEGNFYYLFVYETFRDIRLVGAPPESIGKFGADTDNWMWPRHTNDFSIFRIYCGPDGKPADYSENNVPFKPKSFLSISLDGYKKGDFAFVMGYPGSTQRYMSSWETRYTMDVVNVNRIKIRGVKQDLWEEDMNQSDKIRIQYASKFARSSNYWKYSIGQNKGLKRLHVVENKQNLETQFTAWVNDDAARKAKYGDALNLIEKGITGNWELGYAEQYIGETQLQGSEIFLFALRTYSLAQALAIPDSTEKIKSAVERYQKKSELFYKDYNTETDKKVTKALLKLFMANVPVQYYPDYIVNDIQKKFKNNVDKYVDYLFEKSIMANEAKFEAFLAKPKLKVLAKDPAYIAANSIYQKLQEIYHLEEPGDLKLQKGMRLFEAGLLEMNPGKEFAPDANSTMRLSYGTIGDYIPGDAMHYDYFTTLKGVMEKEDPNNREFNVPEKLKEIYNAKDYGPYGNPDGTMNTCFTTNNDITGGNSGSPVMNAKGQLIGLAFDGNWEAMSGDIAFEKEIQKTICVDVRYVLLIIDKYAGAKNLINEMTLVKTEPSAVN